MIGYINLGILLVMLGFVIGVYVHTDKKISQLDTKLSNRIDENNKALTDRIDRLLRYTSPHGIQG